MNVAESHVLDIGSGHAADDRSIPAVGIPYVDVADKNAFHASCGSTFGATHSRAKPEEDRSVHDIPHGNIADNDVFQMTAVHAFECQSPAMFEYTVGDGDVAESSAALRSELDTSGAVSVVGCLWFVELPASVQYTSFVESADVAIADRYVFRIFETS